MINQFMLHFEGQTVNLIYLALLCAQFSLLQHRNAWIQIQHIIYYSKAMCLIDISVEVITINMFSYVEESWQLETYLIRKDPVAITGNSAHVAWVLVSAVPSHSNPLIHTQISRKTLFNGKSFMYLWSFD